MVDVHLNWPKWFCFVILVGGPLFILISCMIILSIFLDAEDVYINSFFPRTTKLWNSLPVECFPLTFDLNGGFKILSLALFQTAVLS